MCAPTRLDDSPQFFSTNTEVRFGRTGFHDATGGQIALDGSGKHIKVLIDCNIDSRVDDVIQAMNIDSLSKADFLL